MTVLLAASSGDLREQPHPKGAGQFPDTHYPITDYQRVAYATVVRVVDGPDGREVKHMYPVFDRGSAERALALLRAAKPPLTLEERKAVVATASRHLTAAVTELTAPPLPVGPPGTPPPSPQEAPGAPQPTGLWAKPRPAA